MPPDFEGDGVRRITILPMAGLMTPEHERSFARFVLGSFDVLEEAYLLETFTKYFAVAGGSALGGMLRYYLGGSVLSRIAVPFPFATFVINISGSFIIGFFLTLAAERVDISPHLRLAIAVGFVGAFTTFSTFEYETARLIEEHGWTLGILNVTLSVLVGFLAVMGGILAAHRIEGLPLTSNAAYMEFEAQADESDPMQLPGAARDIRDASIVRKDTSG